MCMGLRVLVSLFILPYTDTYRLVTLIKVGPCHWHYTADFHKFHIGLHQQQLSFVMTMCMLSLTEYNYWILFTSTVLGYWL